MSSEHSVLMSISDSYQPALIWSEWAGIMSVGGGSDCHQLKVLRQSPINCHYIIVKPATGQTSNHLISTFTTRMIDI